MISDDDNLWMIPEKQHTPIATVIFHVIIHCTFWVSLATIAYLFHTGAIVL